MSTNKPSIGSEVLDMDLEFVENIIKFQLFIVNLFSGAQSDKCTVSSWL